MSDMLLYVAPQLVCDLSDFHVFCCLIMCNIEVSSSDHYNLHLFFSEPTFCDVFQNFIALCAFIGSGSSAIVFKFFKTARPKKHFLALCTMSFCSSLFSALMAFDWVTERHQ